MILDIQNEIQVATTDEEVRELKEIRDRYQKVLDDMDDEGD